MTGGSGENRPVDNGMSGEDVTATERVDGVRDDLATLVVGSMCHCDDPDECDDHWEFFYGAEMGHDGEHVRRGRTLEKRHMDVLASLAAAFVAATGDDDG